jgi:hypothetical protein
MSAELIIPIKANADQMLATIKLVTDQMDKLSAKINSLPTGDKQLNKLVREYTRLSNTQQGLLRSFDRLGTQAEASAPKLEKVADSSKSARTALTSLSLVVQDLPFGFIGIQNNLPGIIQGFGNLTTSTQGKVLPALKILGQSLIGPAGIFLAFSAVTSIVTELIQDYGSLGAAIEALFGVQKSLTSQIREYNKEYDDFIKKQQTSTKVTQDAKASQEGQISIVQALAKRATDLTLSQKDQKDALQALSKVDKDYFGNLVYGKSTVEDIKNAVERYTKVLVAKSKIQAYSDEISATQTLIEENNRLKKAQDSVVESDKKRSFQGQTAIGIGNEAVSSVISQTLAIRGNKKEQDNLANSNKILQDRIETFKKLIAEQSAILAANTLEFERGGSAIKDYFESYKPSKEYYDFFKDLKNTSIYNEGVKFFNELSNLDLTKGANSVKQFNEILKNLQDRFPGKFIDIIVPSPKDLRAAFDKLRKALDQELKGLEKDIEESEMNKRLTEQFYSGLDFAKETFKKIREEARKTQKSLTDLIPPSTENIIGLGPSPIEKALAQLFDARNKIFKAREDFLRNFKDTTAILNDVFFNPLEDQFKSLITTGKLNLQEFSKIVVENMKALAAKILATGIITLLGMIVTGGFSPETLSKTKLTGFQLFGKAFASALGFGGTSGANFGGVNPGGLAMRGAVSLSLRGSDLVGAINRTNTNISRIG